LRQAWAYVCDDHDDVSADDWDLGQFDRDHLVGYLKHCAAWRKTYDARTMK